MMVKTWAIFALLLLTSLTGCIPYKDYTKQADALTANPKPTQYYSPYLSTLQQILIASTSNSTLKKLITNCMLNTLQTTVVHNATDAFVITGDIDAMWLRDSMNQLHPFVEFVKNDTAIDWLVQKVIARQASQIRADPYANAFNYQTQVSMDHAIDVSTRLLFGGVPFNAVFDTAIVFQRKYQIDSLAAFLRLSNQYYQSSNSTAFIDSKWVEAYERIMKVIEQQRKATDTEDADGQPAYTFSRTSTQPSESLQGGRGNPTSQCGLIRSGFRPSDDATMWPYFIPGNCMMQAELNRSISLLKAVNLKGYEDRVSKLLSQATIVSAELKAAIYKYGVTKNDQGQDIFAYEVDCFGNALKMDDANSPSLLSLPYLGFVDSSDTIYQNTRKYIWSNKNPYFFKGTRGQGIGGPHVGHNYIWPMSIIMKGLTSKNETEIAECLRTIADTTGGTFFMHEAFYKDDDKSFTRSWFAWANTLFGHFVLKIYRQFPNILKNF